jgi:intraflagellar transport protein 80
LHHRYLAAAAGEETLPRFQELQDQVPLDEGAIRGRIQEEKAKELQRPGAKRYV